MKANDTKASETRADIVAEMRTKAECAISYDDGIVMMLTDFADRLDAAAKREAEGRREVMNIEELEAIADAMAEEGGDQIDALYDTVTLQNDTYNGFICRLREVVRLAKNEQEKSAPVGNAAEMRKALENIVKVGYPHNFQHEAPHISGYCYEITDAITKCFEALAAAPRNCDAFSKAEVIKVLEDRSFSKEDTIEWLFTEAEEQKGDAK